MQIRLTLYYLHDPERDTDELIRQLKLVSETVPGIVASYIGRNCGVVPPGMPVPPELADVTQVNVFETTEAAEAYRESPALRQLHTATDHMVRRAAAAEFVQEL